MYTYGQDGEEESVEKLHSQFNSASSNIYKTPVYTDRSVIKVCWVVEAEALGERGGSEAKLSNNEPTLEDIGKGIEQLWNLAS